MGRHIQARGGRSVNPTILPENILSKMAPKDRASLGKSGITAAEAQAKFQAGEEKKLQGLIANYLGLHQIYFEVDRMDRRTSGKRGRPDFRLCYRGRFIGIECKAANGKLSPEQQKTLDEIKASGGLAIVAYSLADVQDALLAADQLENRNE